MNKLRKHILVTTTLFLIVYSLAVLYATNKKQLRIDKIIELENEEIKNKMNLILNSYESIANIVYENEINTPEITKLIYEGLHSEGDERKKYRKILRKKMVKLNNSLIKEEIRQFHFHLNTNESFLRMHKPKKYGDDLSGIRETVELVNQNKTFYKGFEEGRIFNGYRYVFPIFHKNEHVGSVEISISMAVFIKKLDNYNTFIIDKNVVENKVYKEEQSNYINSDISEDYFYDKKVQEKEEYLTISKEKIFRINKEIYKEIQPFLNKKEEFKIIKNIDFVDYLIAFIPIKNILDNEVAYIINYKKVDDVTQRKRLCKQEIIMLSFLILISLIFTIYKGKTDLKLKKMVKIDGLTNLYNHNSIYEELSKEVKRCRRYKEDLSVIMFDIDYFKKVNDKYGHQVGDEVLRTVAKNLKEVFRESDLIGRYGGEEFLVVLPKTIKIDAFKVAERCRKIIEKIEFPSEKSLHINISGGIKEWKNGSVLELVNEADKLLYSAKERGRNRIEW